MGSEMGGACSKHGEMRNAYEIVVGKPETKRPLGRPRRDEKITCEWILLGKRGGKVWSGFIWLRIGASGRLL
jgi:hypothetical protein